MTYFGFLLTFIVPVIVFLALLVWDDHRKGLKNPQALQGRPPIWTLIAHVIVALVYTTPWDNYLVATRVWWYDDNLVTGILIGWVPIEEYTFFLLLPLLSGLWLIWLSRRLTPPSSAAPDKPRMRLIVTGMIGVIWLVSTVILLSGYQPAAYMTLLLSWALIPIMIQTIFGADILWHHRTLIGVVIGTTVLYYAATDAIAISQGTWTISPDQSLPLLIGGILPIEEFVFFLMVTTLVTMGMVLVMARESQPRFQRWVEDRLARPTTRQSSSDAAGNEAK
ncbi:MAG: lycopene cyclase domain-containing protein [Chloroflexi bacterium]|nr:lycopene cyclase domain-containing protein [Chloroflexota bacterium]